MRRSEIYFVSVIVLSLASLVQNIAGTLPASYFSFYARAGLHKVSKSLLDESENQKNNALSEEGSWMIKAVWGITFCVSDLARAKKFYTETLGLEKKYEYPSYVGFECGGVEIGLIPRLKKGQKVGPSSPPVEFLVNDAQKVYDELRKKGVKFTKELHEEQWGGRQATFTDPDGNTLEIVQVNWEKYFAVSAEGAKKKQ